MPKPPKEDAKKRTAKKGSAAKGDAPKGDAEKDRELLGVGLIALALFLALALFPVEWLGEAGERWFPSNNAMGDVGGLLRGGTQYLFGVASWAFPVLVGVAGFRVGGWMTPERALRVGSFVGGLLLLVPAAAHVFARGPEAAGLVGGLVGTPILTAFGEFGAGFTIGVALLLLTLATIGRNPLRPVLAAIAAAPGWGVRKLGEWNERRREARAGEEAGADVEGGPGDGPSPEEQEAEDPWVPPRDPTPTGLPAPEPESWAGDGGDLFATLEELPSAVETPAEAPAAAAAKKKKEKGPESSGILPDPRDPRELSGHELPPLDLLEESTAGGRGDMERELDQLGKILVEKLRSFSVECELGGRTTGPVVTQFEVIPAPGVKVNKIANLDRDIALAMRAKSVRIVAPIPGKGAVGVEIPNPASSTVRIRDIIEAPAFAKSRGDLPLALGKDLHGAPYVSDLTRMPHALIAGATGSGKSVCLNTIITSLVYRHTPETLRLLLIDPKMVELSAYAELPHLRHSVVTDPRDAAGVLKWATLEMERRYALLSENGARSIGEFNRRVRRGDVLRHPVPKGEEGDPDRWIYRNGVLPFVVLVVDELADLMMSVQSEVEKPLTQLAQKARAIGLHLIVATQRPSVNVITGLIKANFPCRIAFRVASKTDSRTILDQNGADALLGDGDMLFLPPGQSEPVRMQGAYISTEETERLIDWYRELRERQLAAGEEEEEAPEEDILDMVRAREAEEGEGEEGGEFDGDWDGLFREAAEVCIRAQQGSTSLLQRKLRIGYGRAARIVDQLHEAGVLGPPDGSKPREVLMTLDQLERLFG